MKLYYPIETNRYIDHNGEEVIETDAVEYEVDDFDIVCAFMRKFHPSIKMAIISIWYQSNHEGKSKFIEAIMRACGNDIEEYFRQRALDGEICSVRGV